MTKYDYETIDDIGDFLTQEIEFGTERKNEMLELTRKFRDNFKKVIKDFEIIPLYYEYRYNFLPRDILV